MPDDTLTIQLDPERKAKLEALAAETDRTSDALVADAIDAYLAAEEAWAERIREGLRQADAGEFASDEEVARVFGLFR